MRPVLFLSLVVCCSALNTFWSEDDTKRLGGVFQNVLSTKKDNIASLHYAASGMKLLKVDPSASSAQAACEVAKKADLKNLDSLYHASSLAGDLPNCALTTVVGAKETIDAVAKDVSASADSILKALSAADRLSIKVDKAVFDKSLTSALKDTSVSSLISGLNAAAYLDKAQSAKYVAKIAVLMGQADLVNKKFMQFEGGLSNTANAVHGILSLATQQGKTSGITNDQLLALSNYLLSRKHVSSERVAYEMVRAIGVLVNNQQQVPVVVSALQGGVYDLGKPIQVQISNVFGLPVAATSFKVDISAVGAKTPLVQGGSLAPNSKIEYHISAPRGAEAGIYVVTVNIESQDKRLIGLTGNTMRVKLVHEVVADNMKIGVLAKDATPSGTSLNSVAKFSKLGKVLEADNTNRLYMSFDVKTKADGKSGKPHQVFVVLTHESGAEVIYTADAQGAGAYIVDMNLAKSHKDFDGLSGKYSARLVVGDAVIKTPIDWTFADLSLTLPAAPVTIVPKSEQVNYNTLPEIVHMFRQPEKRPPAVVSTAFTFVCLAPLLVLAVMWLRIGINFGNMPLSPWVLIFHSALAAMFGLYFVFWLQLDMFETLKYLSLIGTLTFVSGNRLLRALADKRKAKQE